MGHVNAYDTSAETAAHRTQQPTHRIEVQVVRYGTRGPVYRVTYAGDVLIKGCRCPLLDSCRALLARGISGRLELWRPGKATFDAACDVQVGAQHTIIETETESLRLARWSPSPWNAVFRRSIEARTATDASRIPLPTPEEQTRILDAALAK
jgi:hypothetical protein